jgi:hypothetical protein
VSTVKIKGNQYAELLAHVHDGEVQFLTTETRLNTTTHGDLFLGLLREAMRSGKFDSPKNMVNFCAITAELAVATLGQEPAFAIEAPPYSAVRRKVSKAVKDKTDE